MSRRLIVMRALFVAVWLGIALALWPTDSDSRPDWCDAYRIPGNPPECRSE